MKSCFTLRVEQDPRPAIADVSWMDGLGWVLNRINVPGPARGNGYGSKLLKMVTDNADEEGVTLILGPEPSGPLDFDALVAWYQRNGFQWTRSGACMERKPHGE